ncbi:MAG: ribonuclease H [Arcobacter sp.]|nr:ribonuclease H [Arcobacter sp.]
MSIKLFCDGSVNPQKKIGFASYFLLFENESFEEARKKVKTKLFENTSSTKLELESLLWALEDKDIKDKNIIVYTDCQNILSLENRREKLEKNNYQTSTGKIVKNHELYKKFYEVNDILDCKFQKVKGHKASLEKDDIDKFFNIVDKASRKALRDKIKTCNIK